MRVWAEAAGANQYRMASSLHNSRAAESRTRIANWLSGGPRAAGCMLADSEASSKAILGSASVDGATMEEKAAEGNVAYFAEFPSEELDRKLTRHRDEDERTLLHIAAAAGARASPSPARPTVAFPDPRPRHRAAHPPLRSPTPRPQARPTSSNSSSPPTPVARS